MFRFLGKLILAFGLAALVAIGLLLYRSPDPVYTMREWMNRDRFSRFNPVIIDVSKRYNLDPMLVKAVIWRESSFHPEMLGKNGERGLMQVTEGAAQDWVRVQKIETFVPDDLYNPKTNIDVGAWYLSQAMQHWSTKDDPIPFALAEYNAGKRRVDRWISESNLGDNATANDLRTGITFPGTRDYVDIIVERYRFYKARGRL